MRLLLASSEAHPFSKSGGLADMVAALAKSLGRAGHQVGLVTPLHRGIRERFKELQPFDYTLDLPLGLRRVQAQVVATLPEENVTVYFIDCPPYFDRAGLYNEAGQDYADNAARFIFFSKCVAHLARYLPWRPELVHVHDWQVGLVPLLLRHQKLRERWAEAPPSVLTIHNLAYQGIFPRAAYDLTNLPPEHFGLHGVEFYTQLGCLKAGIVFADMLTTVSPTYAREITTPEFGCGLDAVLRGRGDALVGILNGVDYDEWKTTGNPHLSHAYSLDDLSGKQAMKLELQKELGLPAHASVPLFGNITRLTEQKGVDLQLTALEELLAEDLQFVLLGSGGPQLEEAYRSLAIRHPSKVAVRIGFDQGLSHRIEAAADFFLMPSRFEPCGLNQMYSQRYGTIPIVRATGGLEDTVIDLTQDQVRADGIKFREFSAPALTKAIRKALVLYQTPVLLAHMQRNAMQADFSWERTLGEFEQVYQRALRR